MRKAGIRDSGFGIRKARTADARAILDLERHFPSDRMSLRSVRRFIASPSARVWVAAATNPESRIPKRLARVPASLALPDDVRPNPDLGGALILMTRRGSRTARIYSLVVGPEGRGRGLGSALVERAERAARRLGCAALSLEVRADNAAARALYARRGYADERALPGFYDDGADGLKLRKVLNRR
ncbi:MAG TPA: GNAT family N-acetyltransferase [Solimonas sp.]|nr:GNAT family N-acetyltransferase [Solimonas sp.]